jgi:hypothetical protein
MARLGELLISARLIEPEKVEQALRAQVVWGGRLGTNLIELGCIDLDGLSRALGRQHGLPAALARHFDKADITLQRELSPDIAKMYSVVPLLKIGGRRIAVVALDPLPPDAIAALADVYFCTPADIVVSVAAEMRVRYHLERVYGIQRHTRFLRSRGKTITPFPQFDADFAVESDSVSDVSIPIVVEPGQPPRLKRAPTAPPAEAKVDAEELAALAALIDEASAASTAHDPDAGGRERRTYVRTLAEAQAPDPGITDSQRQAQLARIAIKRVAVNDKDGTPIPPSKKDKATGERTAISDAVPTTLVEATRGIRRANNRDRVAELIIDSIQRFQTRVDTGLLLVIRGAVAIGWKHFGKLPLVPHEIAMPLDQGGLLPAAAERNATVRAACSELCESDQLLLRALGKDGGDLAIVPIAIADRVMCLIATVAEHDAPVAVVESVATAAGSAFARLMRNASR